MARQAEGTARARRAAQGRWGRPAPALPEDDGAPSIDWKFAVPLIHAVATCFFLAGYCYGFDHHIVLFISTADLFRASVRDMGQTYLAMLLPAVIFLTRLPLFARWKKARAAIWTIVGATALAVALAVLHKQISHAATLDPKGTMLLVVMGLLMLCAIAVALRADSRGSFVPAFVACLILFALAHGWQKGWRDAGRPYSSADRRYPLCGGGRIMLIRGLGDHFLAVDDSQAHVIVDRECQRRAFLKHGGPEAG